MQQLIGFLQFIAVFRQLGDIHADPQQQVVARFAVQPHLPGLQPDETAAGPGKLLDDDLRSALMHRLCVVGLEFLCLFDRHDIEIGVADQLFPLRSEYVNAGPAGEQIAVFVVEVLDEQRGRQVVENILQQPVLLVELRFHLQLPGNVHADAEQQPGSVRPGQHCLDHLQIVGISGAVRQCDRDFAAPFGEGRRVRPPELFRAFRRQEFGVGFADQFIFLLPHQQADLAADHQVTQPLLNFLDPDVAGDVIQHVMEQRGGVPVAQFPFAETGYVADDAEKLFFFADRRNIVEHQNFVIAEFFRFLNPVELPEFPPFSGKQLLTAVLQLRQVAGIYPLLDLLRFSITSGPEGLIRRLQKFPVFVAAEKGHLTRRQGFFQDCLLDMQAVAPLVLGSHIAEDQDGSGKDAVAIDDGGGAVGNMAARSVFCDQIGMVRQSHDFPGLQSFAQRRRNRGLVDIADDIENIFELLSRSFLRREAGQIGGNLIQQRDPLLCVGDDYSVADGFQRQAHLFGGLLIFEPQPVQFLNVEGSPEHGFGAEHLTGQFPEIGAPEQLIPERVLVAGPGEQDLAGGVHDHQPGRRSVENRAHAPIVTVAQQRPGQQAEQESPQHHASGQQNIRVFPGEGRRPVQYNRTGRKA